MDTQVLTSLRSLIQDSRLDVAGSQIEYAELQTTFDAANFIHPHGATSVLRILLEEMQLKPCLSLQGFVISDKSASNIECPPRNFSMQDFPLPMRSTGWFLPILDKSRLSDYLVHSIRWFKHPLRPGTMLPVRLETFSLGVDHPSSRMYVDLPVLTSNDIRTFRYIRISLNVFEKILLSQYTSTPLMCKLHKTQDAHSACTEVFTSTTGVSDSVYGAAMELHLKTVKDLQDKVLFKPEYVHTMRAVCDHLVRSS